MRMAWIGGIAFFRIKALTLQEECKAQFQRTYFIFGGSDMKRILATLALVMALALPGLAQAEVNVCILPPNS